MQALLRQTAPAPKISTHRVLVTHVTHVLVVDVAQTRSLALQSESERHSTHRPWEHRAAPVHTRPQLLQLFLSVEVFTQELPHAMRPTRHPH